MKYLPLIVLSICLYGCKHISYVEFNGTATGVKSGVFIIKDLSGKSLFGENIIDGKFHMDKKVIEVPGYYTLDIVDDVTKNEKHTPFEIYLEDGVYNITTEAEKLASYPQITAPSPIQQQLTDYYTYADNSAGDLNREIAALNLRVKNKQALSLAKEQYNRLLNRLTDLDIKKQSLMQNALKHFAEKNPKNTIGAHVMARLDYESDPAFFNNIYKNFTPEVRNSDDGKEVGVKLAHLVKLIPGAEAPPIAGKLLDGSAFNPKAMNKILFLIDFWLAGGDIARINHQNMKSILDDFGKKGFEIISVSMDVKEDWWKTSVKGDKINWPQVSDLKGDDSPNVINWSISSIPTYYLVDGNWHIIERNIHYSEIELAVEQYLEKHH